MPKKRGLDHLEGIIAKLSKFVIMISVQENLFKKCLLSFYTVIGQFIVFSMFDLCEVTKVIVLVC